MALCAWTLLACFLALFSCTACVPSSCFINQELIDRPDTYFNCTINDGQAVSEIVWKINGATIKKTQGPINWLGMDLSHKALSGILRCEAKTNNLYVSCEISLTGFPRITTHLSIYDTYVGHRLVVHCKATGNPQPTLTWAKQNSSLTKSTMPKSIRLQRSHDSLDMVIAKASKIHSGIYMCQASNHLGVASHIAVVTVHYNGVHMSPRVVAIRSKIIVQRGNKAVLFCTTAYTPEILTALYWNHGQQRIRGSKRLQQKERYSSEIVDGKYKIGRAAMSLVIKQTTDSDTGVYTCNAVTHNGKGQAQVELIVTD